mmetsp:Transcript_9541/g.29023  ORF Transcript_9541/g.29023 Transcript_9541/m.29023 type:complete len:203 (+) Transcript_9541:2722-3330(+)
MLGHRFAGEAGAADLRELPPKHRGDLSVQRRAAILVAALQKCVHYGQQPLLRGGHELGANFVDEGLKLMNHERPLGPQNLHDLLSRGKGLCDSWDVPKAPVVRRRALLLLLAVLPLRCLRRPRRVLLVLREWRALSPIQQEGPQRVVHTLREGLHELEEQGLGPSRLRPLQRADQLRDIGEPDRAWDPLAILVKDPAHDISP